MSVHSETIALNTRGHADVLDITDAVRGVIERGSLRSGIVSIFTASSTSALTTIEYESGCIADLRRLLDEIAPADRAYAHNARWGDGNGHAHLRAALVGPSLTVPFMEGRLTLGTWQQIIFIDFDNRPRSRELVVQLVGES